jgi:hypothetical protein
MVYFKLDRFSLEIINGVLNIIVYDSLSEGKFGAALLARIPSKVCGHRPKDCLVR